MANPIKISGVVITYNEEQNIERCLTSMAPVCDELLVVDSFSTDRTKEISLKLGARFMENEWSGFKEQKNFAQDQAQFDYVLQLDADEEVSEDLAAAILKVKEDAQFDSYIFNRFTNFCGKWIHHSGWYPDAKLRLYEKDKGKWTGLEPHPSVEMQTDASSTKIAGDLFHYSYTSYEDLVSRSTIYAKQAA